MTPTQQKLVALMRSGRMLWWFGDSGPELQGKPRWPQKRTVRSLLKAGVLRWAEYRNQTQKACGICEIVLAEKDSIGGS